MQIKEIYDYYAQEDVYLQNDFLINIKKIVNIEDELSYDKLFVKLYQFIDANPDDQVKILALSNDNFLRAFRAQKKNTVYNDLSRITQALKLSLNNSDLSLQVATYSFYGKILDEIKEPQKAIYYLKRAEDLLFKLKKTESSLYIHNCFDLSKILYQTFEYKNCINYGKKYLNPLKISKEKPGGVAKIYIMDLIGASYKNLGKSDSSIYYYNQILELLKNKPFDNSYENELWKSIADGNIGENLLNQNKTQLSGKYIESYYNFNKRYDDQFNIALSSNLKARHSYNTGKLADALKLYKFVYNGTEAQKRPELLINAAEGLSNVYREYGIADSALAFLKISLEKKAEVQRLIYETGLDAEDNKLKFEKMESSLLHSKDLISKIRMTRNYLLLSLVLLVLLVISLSLWSRAKWRYKLNEEHMKKRMAFQQIEDSKRLLENMTKNFIEKSEILDSMTQRLDQIEKTDLSIELKDQILDYAFTKEDDWQRFLSSFERVYPTFLPSLIKQLSGINPAEVRLSVLMKVGLTNAQISSSIGISPGSVYKSKYRLKQKLGLDGEQNLENYIQNT